MTFKTDTQDKKLNMILWIIGITFAAFLGTGAIQMISFGEVKVKTVNNSTDIERIQNDYLPYFAFQYIVESNQKLINVLITLPVTTKDDPRYQKAIEEWSQLQQEVVKQVGQNKRKIDELR